MLTPLRVYSEYSLLESSLRAKVAADICNKNEIESIAICDNSNMFGAMQWSLEMQKSGIKPIIGSKLPLNSGFIWIYCKNEEGYVELSNLITDFYAKYDRKIGLNHLFSLKNCIILCDHSLSDDEIEFLSKNFEAYIAISRQKKDLEFEPRLFSLSSKLEMPLVAAPFFHYKNDEDSHALDCLLCIKNSTVLVEDDRERAIEDAALSNIASFDDKFSDIPFAIDNANAIGKKCNFMIKASSPKMPGLDDVLDENAHMKKVAFAGLDENFENYVKPTYPADYDFESLKQKYVERLEYEVTMITKMGFCGYFLIVSDIVSWSKANDIPVGPGRGSGASSLAAWCLKITNIDPFKFNLMFERFLNPDRVSLPDFDIDFCQENRHKVIDYIKNRFGKENVAHIITFGSLQYRAAIRDIGRVMQMPYSKVDDLCKRLPQPFQGVPPTIKEMREDGRLDEFVDDENRELFRIAEIVEGQPRHSSVHAAGVVIGNKKLADILPLYKDPDLEMPIIQFAMKQAEQIGLVKFDILGLTVLSVLNHTIKLVKKMGINLEIDKLPLDDEKTFNMLRAGITSGIFQLDTIGLRQLMVEMQPTCFEDIIAAGALYRPGPMADIPQFIKCKNGNEPIDYLYKEMEPILKDTYGVTVYQEQVLQIAKDMAGYSLKEADLLRRAMGKKIKSEMVKHEKKFVAGVVKTCGGEESKAQLLYNNLARFASYGFPKAHAAPYGMMSYQTAYCKAHFCEAFLCATLYYEHTLEKGEEFIQEAKKLNIEVLPPCVNKSADNFDLQGKSIRFGLGRVKGVGDTAKTVIAEREKNGPFSSIKDFIRRVRPNKRVLESMVYSGGFDCFGESRAVLFDQINNKDEVESIGLFDFDDITPEWNEIEKIEKEFGVLSTVISNTFLEKSERKLGTLKFHNKLVDIKDHGLLFALGIKNKSWKTKDGREFNAFTFLDANGVQGIISGRAYEDFNWEKVILSLEKKGFRYTINSINKADNFLRKYRRLFLNIPIANSSKFLGKLKPGGVSIFLKADNEFKRIGDFDLTFDFLNQVNDNIEKLD